MLRFLSGCFGMHREDLGLESHFKVLKKIGYGVEGEVFLCEERATGELVAIKTIPRGLQPAHQRMLTNEALIHYQLAASNAAVVRIRELVLSQKCLGFVMEYMSGGTLQGFVESQKRLDEDMAAYLFRQVLMAVEKCHVHRVAYRDLKPDNCLLTADNPPRLKLCDFGVSKQWSKDSSSKMATIAGTPGYLCPEMLGKLLYGGTEYDAVKSDVWSMGALLSHMLLGHSPFYFEEVAEFTGMKGALQFAYEVEVNSTWRHEAASRSDKVAKLDMSMISESAKQLLDILLDKNPEVRPSITDIQSHPWVMRPLPPKYQTALDSMAAEQSRLESRANTIPDDLPDQVLRLVAKACNLSTHTELSLERISMQAPAKSVGAKPVPVPLQSLPSQLACRQTNGGGELMMECSGWDEDESLWSASQSVLMTSEPESALALTLLHGSEGEASPAQQRLSHAHPSPSRPYIPSPAQPEPESVPTSTSQSNFQTLSAPLTIPLPKTRLRRFHHQQQQRRPVISVSLPGSASSRQASTGSHTRRLATRRISLSSKPQESLDAKEHMPSPPPRPAAPQQTQCSPQVPPQQSKLLVFMQKEQQKVRTSSLTQQLRDQAQLQPEQTAHHLQQHLQLQLDLQAQLQKHLQLQMQLQQDAAATLEDTSADDCAKLDTLQRVSLSRKSIGQNCRIEVHESPVGLRMNHTELSGNHCSIVLE